MRKKIISHNINDLRIIARDLLNYSKNFRIFAIYGELGAGKTTLVKNFCLELGASDDVSSPTFSIINQYKASGGRDEHIYHFDLYRIRDKSEVYDLGYEDYFYGNSFCFIEWPEKIETLLPPNYVQIEIIRNSLAVETREIIIKKVYGSA